MLKGKQSKMDKNKDGKISGADFKMMKDGGKVGYSKGGKVKDVVLVQQPKVCSSV